MAATDVSVIIVTWNVNRLVEACLRSIGPALGGLAGEVVVVDNASADGTADLVRRMASRVPRLRVLEPGANLGFAAANNLAIARSSGQYLLLLNPDTELAPHAVEQLVDCARQHRAAIVGARHRNPDGSLQPSVRRLPTPGVLALHLLKLHRLLPNLGSLRRYYARDVNYAFSQPAEQVAGSCLLVDRAVLARLGRLDEGFTLWFEEVDLCRRAQAASLAVWYCAQAEVVHHGAASFSQLNSITRQRQFNRSLLTYARKHFGAPAWLLLAALHPLSLTLAALAPRLHAPTPMMLFNRWWWIALAAMVGLEAASFAGYVAPGFGAIAFVATVGTAAVSSITRLEYGAYLLAAELALGGHGYLLRLSLGGVTLSLRHALFMVLIAAWVIQISRDRAAVLGRLRQAPRGITVAYLALLAVLSGATLNGWLQHEPATVFLDANAWLFLLLAPVVVSALRTTAHFWRLTQVVTAAATVVAIKTLWLLYAFARAAPGTELVYRWIRDLRLGEIAHISGPVYRIFLPSQLFALVTLALVTALLLGRTLKNRRDLLLAGTVGYLASLTLLVSQSRSFWVGGMIAVFTLLGVAYRRFGYDPRRVALVGLLAAFVVFTQQSVVSLVTGADAGLYRRLQDIPTEPAGASRLNQLGPLASAITNRPLLGSGFGAAVTYRSLDPRIVKSHPGGWITTTAFELGYLDVALKTGLIGLAILVWLVAAIVVACLNLPVTSPWAAPSLGWGVALIGVAITHAFSPYLNHPLGLGVWLFAAASAMAARATTASSASVRGDR